MSSLYFSNDPAIDGKTPITTYNQTQNSTGWYVIPDIRVNDNIFNTATLLFSKISCSYTGRTDIQSGYMGICYN